MTLLLVPEGPCLAAPISDLAAKLFQKKSAPRAVDVLRAGHAPLSSLGRVLKDMQGGVAGSIRYWPISVGATKALLLGPVMVDPRFSGKSYPELHGRKPGMALIEDTLKLAAQEGHKLVVLKAACADLMPYYAQFGFKPLMGVKLPTTNGAEEAKLLMALSLDPTLPLHQVRGAITGGWAAATPSLAVVRTRRSLRPAPALTRRALRLAACG